MHYDVVSAIKKNKIMNDSYALSIYKDQNNFGPFQIVLCLSKVFLSLNFELRPTSNMF